MRAFKLGLLALAVAGCSGEQTTTDSTQALSPALKHGRDVWFKETFGGEKFFSAILPGPPFNLPLGLDVALTSPRATRFNTYGLINDPDCTPGDASTFGFDRCEDPESAGVVGVRKKIVQTPTGPRIMIGVACASCHAGFDPVHPPANPNEPTWENIHPTTGNQYINIAKIFASHLSPHDPRYQVFNSWAPGTVDTTAIESDGINNPGIITQFFNVPDRPFFELTDNGEPIYVHRGGQGGEDDTGCEKAALRVYFNIGMCAAECMVGHLANGPGGSQTEIDDAECSAACPEYVRAKSEVTNMCAFMATAKTPKLADAPNGESYVDTSVIDRGKKVFKFACAGCHSNGEPPGHDVLSDDEIWPMAVIGTNSCRARTTNWMEGRIWGQFSSDQYKARPTGGPGFYRDVPLLGIWATAPFFHNNRLGGYNGDPSVAGRIAAYEDAMDQLLNPTHRNLLGSIQRTTDWIQLPNGTQLPAGTPVAAFANVNPANGQNLCPDFLENQGHYFGATLSAADKYALKEYLKTK
jgi:mono/diheme cytochrome c family protein